MTTAHSLAKPCTCAASRPKKERGISRGKYLQKLNTRMCCGNCALESTCLSAPSFAVGHRGMLECCPTARRRWASEYGSPTQQITRETIMPYVTHLDWGCFGEFSARNDVQIPLGEIFGARGDRSVRAVAEVKRAGLLRKACLQCNTKRIRFAHIDHALARPSSALFPFPQSSPPRPPMRSHPAPCAAGLRCP